MFGLVKVFQVVRVMCFIGGFVEAGCQKTSQILQELR